MSGLFVKKLKRFLKTNVWAFVGIALLTVFFCICLRVVRFSTEDFYGRHSWLSGSTINYVNNWLKEGALNLKFTNYDYPDSIEHSSLEDRGAYLSYPTGEVFFVYSFARLTGQEKIDISFLRTFQAIWFWVEAVLIFVFVWLFMRRTIKSKHKIENTLIALCTSAMWVLMPSCTYYLANVYFADQCVILWIIAYVLANYIRWTSEKNKLSSIVCVLLLFSGILIDYYFWFFAFFVFVYDLVRGIMIAKKKEKAKTSIGTLLFHGVPTVLALLTFYWQLSQTSNWLSVLTFKAKYRMSGVAVGKSSIEMIIENIQNAFALNPAMIIFLVGVLIIAILLFVKLLISKKDKKNQIINDPGFGIFVVYFLATATQILVLRNHSGIHEFSMIKIAWIVAMLPLFIATCIKGLAQSSTVKEKITIVKRIKVSRFTICYFVGVAFVVCATGIPFSTKDFYESRWTIDQLDYNIARVLEQETRYEDVVFSYTHEILGNPPQEISISKKAVHKISELDDMKTLFPDLSSEANLLLLIEKPGDEQESEQLEKDQAKSIKCVEKRGLKRFENDEMLLYEVEKDSECFNK